MSELQEYKCPCCGGAIEFNISAQKLKCPYCDTEFEMDALSDYESEKNTDGCDNMNWDTSGMKEWQEGEEEGIRIYICQSCGGEIVADENTVASACPYCDSPIVMKSNVLGILKPEVIIPFKYDKKAAKERFKAHLSNKKFLPKVFKTENHIDEIKGIYVPYWLFDSKAQAKMRYRATRKRVHSDSKNIYHETFHYAITRGGSIAFAHVPVDGASKLDDTLMESLEPYDFNEAVQFDKGYLAGYMADKYDVDEESSRGRANERVKNSTAAFFRSTIRGYDTVVHEGGNIQLEEGKASYAMYPVWIMTTKWNGEQYLFAMNGQTGKFVGDLPVDKAVAVKTFLSVGGIVTAITFAILTGIWFI